MPVRFAPPLRPHQIGLMLAIFHAGGRMAVQLSACIVLAGLTISAALAKPPQPGAPFHIVVLGDSLVAGFRLSPTDAFPVKLGKALAAKGLNVEVANAGVSGDTSSGGRERVDWAVPDGTDLVILELGANDALRGLPPDATRRNLDATIKHLKAKGVAVLLAGMRAPRNWGDDYVARFEAIYPGLAKAHGIPLYPFFLDGVATRANLNLDDGLHPNPKGVDEIVRRILPAVEHAIANVLAAR